MSKELSYGEEIALAITYAMRNDTTKLQQVLADLKTQGYDDYQIGEMFMDIGRIVFNEEEQIETTEGELMEIKQAAIAGERDKIIALMSKYLCFDFLDSPSKCEHSACHEISNLMARIARKEHLA